MEFGLWKSVREPGNDGRARHAPSKCLRNFIVANVCAVLPLLWAGLGWMPDQVKIYMAGNTETPGAVVGNGVALAGEIYGNWPGGRIFRFYLPNNLGWDKLAFRLPGQSGAAGVARIELQKWKLVSLSKSGRGLEPGGKGQDEYVFPDPRFDGAGVAGGMIPRGLAGAEILLLALSWICACRHREETWLSLCPVAVGVAAALTFQMQVALPVQSYLANQSAYAHATGELLGAVGARFALVGVPAAVSLALLARYFGRWVLSAALAFGVCVYLESGLFSSDLPSLNGDWWFFYNPKRTFWDLAAWGGVFAAVLGAHPFLRKHQGGFALCLAVMVAASMLDIQKEEKRGHGGLIVEEFVPIEEVIRNVTYSTNRNVLVFVLDSLEREQAHAALENPEAGPGLRERFRGFTEYTENVGACPQTLTAVPNLLTGRYPGEGPSGAADYAWSCYSGASALSDFLEGGKAVYVTTVGLGCGYASDGATAGTGEKDDHGVLARPGKVGGTWSVKDISRWRWLPFGAKAGAASLVELGTDSSRELREWIVYPILAAGQPRTDGKDVFVFVHTEGVHVPVRYNRRGEMLSGRPEGGDVCVEQGIFVLAELGRLMDSYREAGIYDRSLILVMGDHGGHGEQGNAQDQAERRLPRRARPCLWVKPEGSTHDFAASPLPTSHANVSALLKASVGRRLAEGEIQAILQSDRRTYREMALWGTGHKDWVVHRDGTFEIMENGISGDDGSNPKPLKTEHWYSLYWRDMGHNDADILFEGMAARAFPVFAAAADEVTLRLRVPDPERKYTLKLRTGESGHGRLLFHCDASGEEWQASEIVPYDTVVLRGMTAGKNGMATIAFRRGPGPREDIAFPSLLLEEER